MTHRALLKLAASGLVMGGTLTGCTGLDLGKLSPASADARMAQSAEKASTQYERLKARGDVPGASAAAEAAVAAEPANAAYRTQLGHAYFAAGRFASAQTAFQDARDLGATDAKTIVSLALALSANNRENEAVALLDDNKDTLTASDLGLALALSGQHQRAVMILDNAARAEGATAQTRQNLAFAYAMNGRWLESKLVAAQDMSIANLDARMSAWAAIAQSPSANQRIAGMIGVQPVADPGLPVRLALVDTPATQLALADEAVAEMTTYNRVTDTPEVADYSVPAPVQMEFASAPSVDLAEEAGPDVVLAEIEEPYREAVAELLALNEPESVPLAQETALERVAAAAVPSVPEHGQADADEAAAAHTGWAVQLGAFGSNAAAENAWDLYSKRFAALDSFSATSHFARVNGKGYYRLTANGLGNRGSAVALCNSVKRSGGVCFVRNLTGSEDVRWASRGNVRNLASR